MARPRTPKQLGLVPIYPRCDPKVLFVNPRRRRSA